VPPSSLAKEEQQHFLPDSSQAMSSDGGGDGNKTLLPEAYIYSINATVAEVDSPPPQLQLQLHSQPSAPDLPLDKQDEEEEKSVAADAHHAIRPSGLSFTHNPDAHHPLPSSAHINSEAAFEYNFEYEEAEE
jgi:hypothetical protein